MSTGYKIIDTGNLYFVTFQVVKWVDVFTRQSYRDIILESLDYCIKNKGLIIHAYVIMSNHLHLIIRSQHGNLSDIIRDFKKHTSRQIIKTIEENTEESRKDWMLWIFRRVAQSHARNTHYQFWTQENHAELLYSEKFIEQKLNYIHTNPVRAAIVKNAEEYLYSSAKDYSGEKGFVEVELLHQRCRAYGR